MRPARFSAQMGDRQVDGEVTIDLQLPDKCLRTDSISPMGDGALIVTDQGVNGDTAAAEFADARTPRTD